MPSPETRQYQAWIRQQVARREQEYRADTEAGLFSILTAVWDGSPLQHLRTLAQSIEAQQQSYEWVILDNGCRNRQLVCFLDKLGGNSQVKLIREERNVGIIRGLRDCLETASGRYVLPVDGDDVLYPDALRVIASVVAAANYPPLLYTDEDKVIGRRVYQPYFKPDWDPVLLLNSAYIAHLGVMDRSRALDLGVYSNAQAEGSPDWDAFVRFLIAGYSAVHIPEVVYSWRVHAQSTADDAASKPYIHSSQKAVLQQFLDAHPLGSKFEIGYSPLFRGAAHWHFVRRQEETPAMATVAIRHLRGEARSLRAVAERRGFVHLVGEDVASESSEWMREAEGIFDLHPDAVMIGGLIQNRQGMVYDAGRSFGFGGVCGCPYRGRAVSDLGYFGQLSKQRSVSAVSSQFAMVRAEFLRELLEMIPATASLACLGAWAGAYALRGGKRVVYSPFMRAISDVDWDALVEPAEWTLFAEKNHDVIPDRRFYPRPFSLQAAFQLEFGN